MSAALESIDVSIVSVSVLLRRMLASTCEQAGMHVLECAGSVEDLDRGSRDSVMIMHIADPGDDLDAIIDHLHEVNPCARIILLCNEEVVRAARPGPANRVAGLLSDHYAPETLTAAMRLVAVGLRVQPCVDQADRSDLAMKKIRNRPVLKQSHEAYDLLTKREIAVLARLRDGQENKAIARDLDISEATVKVHLRALFRKTGARNRTQAALWAARRL